MKKPKRLNPREIRILSMLANGDTSAEICSYFGISSANLHTTCFHIRKKTGLQQTRDPDECKRHLSKLDKQQVADAINPVRVIPQKLTHCQLEVFRLISLGRSYPQIAVTLGILPQSVQNLAVRACKRAGITHSGWNRTRFIKEWMARYRGEAPPLAADPMDDPMF